MERERRVNFEKRHLSLLLFFPPFKDAYLKLGVFSKVTTGHRTKGDSGAPDEFIQDAEKRCERWFFGHARPQLIFLPLYHTSYLGPLLPSTLGSYQGLIAAFSAICPPSAGCTVSTEEI